MPARPCSAARRTRTGKAPTACPAFVRWPGQFPGRHDAQRHRRARGLAADIRRRRPAMPDIKDKLLAGRRAQRPASTATTSTATTCSTTSPARRRNRRARSSCTSTTTARSSPIRYDDWKVVFLENRGQAFGVWREPFTELRVPLLFNLRRDPFERRSTTRTPITTGSSSGPSSLVPAPGIGGEVPHDNEGLSAQPDHPARSTWRRSRSRSKLLQAADNSAMAAGRLGLSAPPRLARTGHSR